MSEEMDKQEPASQRKLSDAKQKGQSHKSAELSATASMLVVLIGVIAVAPTLAYSLYESTSWLLENAGIIHGDWLSINVHIHHITGSIISLLAPIAVGAGVAAILVTVANSGIVFSTSQLGPDFTKLNPANGLKKIASKKNIIDTARLIAKLSFISIAMFTIWRNISTYLFNMATTSPTSVSKEWLGLATECTTSILSIYVIFAAVDVWFSRRDFAKRMRMSRKELMDEHKNQEGDPLIKSKRKRSQQDLLIRLTSITNVKSADVIITNPTHVAVALQYKPGSMSSPKTISMGRGLLAKLILISARRHGIPITRRPRLARALLREGAIGHGISHERFEEVASVYRWIINVRGDRALSE